MKAAFLAGGLLCAGAVAVPQAMAAPLSQCVEGLKKQAVAAGVSASVASAALDGVAYDERVVRFSTSQPEYKTPIWDYLAFLVDNERIADGKAMMRRHDRTLRAVERAYGVDRYVVAAVWGVESDYGREAGSFFVPHALANLVCAGGRRANYFKGELIEILKIASRGDVRLSKLNGSWAGAFGQTQFMPSTYSRLAVDFDRDGRRDLVESEADALASTAAYLKASGWRSGLPWGFEVRLPAGYKGPSGRKAKASLDTWRKRGLARVDGKALSGGTTAGLLVPAGTNGPAFLVTRNFDAIYSYNVAESYALAISHLSDRLKGARGFATPWPTDDPGLSRAERLDLQRRLIAAGYDIGEADGKIGPVTRAAIKSAETRLGMKPTGRAGRKIYQALGGR